MAKRVENGEDYESALRELGRKVLPQTKGGKVIRTRRLRVTLKVIHYELQDCIKEIRTAMDIPITKNSPYSSWGTDMTDDIKERFPAINYILSSKEMASITKKKNPAELSLEIIHSRLKKAVPSPIKERSLRKVLDRTKIPS
jgi:hypothetical protein